MCLRRTKKSMPFDRRTVREGRDSATLYYEVQFFSLRGRNIEGQRGFLVSICR